MEIDEVRRVRRGRQPLPETTRGETLSCYIPRWAVDRLQELADDERLSRNMLVRRVLLAYLGAPGEPGATGHSERAALTEGQG